MQRVLRWGLLALTVYWCFFIWHFSLASAGESAATSGRFLTLFNDALEQMGVEFRFNGTMVRKIAHFAEFAILGFLCALTWQQHRFSHPVWLSFPVVIIVAGIDELLQFTSPGRGPSFLDVLLDTAGGLCGVFAFSLLTVWVLALRSRKNKKSEK